MAWPQRPESARLLAALEDPGRGFEAGARAHSLEPDPVTAPVVRRIFELRLAGNGAKRIANVLNAEGVPCSAAQDAVWLDTERIQAGWITENPRTQSPGILLLCNLMQSHAYLCVRGGT
ncbi:recombinase family protein [Streptomonospora algeriensis]|uniref:Recombinase family protein n=1 Tax=Streptomonospora algeriensis TaxID=995084 RepID=A0ABW3BA36_9ACTN